MAFLFISISLFLFSDSYENAEQAFRLNKMQEAIQLFEAHLKENNPNPLSYNYLGLAYYKRGDKKKALDVFLEGTKKPQTNKRLLYYNAGNMAFSMGLYGDAEQYFSLSSSADPSFSSPLINRANTRVKLAKLLLAIEDYQAYLVLEPESNQKDKISQMIALLENELQNQKRAEELRLIEDERIEREKERLAQEQKEMQEKLLQAQIEEQERLAQKEQEERERLAQKEQEERERRQKLMDEIAASLQNTESANIRAGTEGVMEYDYEFELD